MDRNKIVKRPLEDMVHGSRGRAGDSERLGNLHHLQRKYMANKRLEAWKWCRPYYIDSST